MKLLNSHAKLCPIHARALALSFTWMLLIGCAGAQAQREPIAPVAAAVVQHEPVAADESFRAVVPKPGPEPVLNAPVPIKTVLKNGLTVLFVPKRSLPLVHVSALIKTGSAQEPKNLEGLAGVMLDVMKAGTPTRDADAVATEIESLGASLNVRTDEDMMTLSTQALTLNMGAALDVFADVLQHPSFKVAEVERIRRQQVAALVQSEGDPKAVARQVFRKVIFNTHPYGHTPAGTPPSIAKLKAKDLIEFYRAHVRPANTAIVVVGDLDKDEAVRQIDERLGNWSGRPGVQKPPVVPKVQKARVALIDRPGAPQSQVLVGDIGLARDTPDYFSTTLCNAILGGLFNSRINMNLREDKGWTYGAFSAFQYRRAKGAFFVGGGIRTDVTQGAILEIIKELDGIRDADVTLDELQAARNRYSLSLPGSFQSNRALSDMVGSLYLYDLPLDYLQNIPKKLAEVTVADVRHAAQSYLHPEAMSIVVVGDKAQVLEGLTELNRGLVHMLDAWGHDAATPRAQTGKSRKTK